MGERQLKEKTARSQFTKNGKKKTAQQKGIDSMEKGGRPEKKGVQTLAIGSGGER